MFEKDEHIDRLIENVRTRLVCICSTDLTSFENGVELANTAHALGWRCPDALHDGEVFCPDCYQLWAKAENNPQNGGSNQ